MRGVHPPSSMISVVAARSRHTRFAMLRSSSRDKSRVSPTYSMHWVAVTTSWKARPTAVSESHIRCRAASVSSLPHPTTTALSSYTAATG